MTKLRDAGRGVFGNKGAWHAKIHAKIGAGKVKKRNRNVGKNATSTANKRAGGVDGGAITHNNKVWVKCSASIEIPNNRIECTRHAMPPCHMPHSHSKTQKKEEKRVEKRSKMAGKKCKNAQRSAVANGGRVAREGESSRAEVQPAGRGRTAAAAAATPTPLLPLSALQ